MIDRHRPRPHTAPFWLAVLAVALLTATAARADLFEIRQVAVDVTAETANEARQQALSAAEREAFNRLMQRLVDEPARRRLGEVDAATITDLVFDLSVNRERASATRYLGEFTVRFRPEAVQSFLASRGTAVMVTESPPVVVLPVYRDAGLTVLWDHPNPWRDAWDGAPPPADLVPLILPDGDLADVAAISADGAVAGDLSALRTIAARYATTEVIVAVAESQGDAAGGPRGLAVNVRRYGPDGVVSVLAETIGAGADGAGDGVYPAAVARVGAAIDAAWRGATTVDLGDSDPAVLVVTAPIDGLRDWVALQRRLKANPAVRDIDVVLLARTEVRLNLHYLGSLQQLGITLQQSDLALVRRDDGWILSSGAGPNAAGPDAGGN